VAFEEVFAQAKGTEDEVHMLLVGVVKRIEGVVAAGFCGVRRVENPQVLQPASCGNVRQKTVKELAVPLAIEDNHGHFPRAKASRQILGNDVFKEGGLAGAGAANDYSVLDSHGIRPEPWLFVHVVAEQSSRTRVRIGQNL